MDGAISSAINNAKNVAIAVSQGYTKKTVEGMGALKGANCTIDATRLDAQGNTIIVFGYTDNNGVKHTEEITVQRGQKGDNGKDGINGIDGNDGADGKDGNDGVSVEKLENVDGRLICTMSDGTIVDAGELPKGDRGERGEKGEKGEQGEQGLQGIQGERGENAVSALNPKGNYDDVETYSKNDYVTDAEDNNNAYVCTSDDTITGFRPSENLDKWQLLALAGARGEQGIQGPQGPPGTVDVDTEMSDESTNAVENKAIKKYVDDNLPKIASTTNAGIVKINDNFDLGINNDGEIYPKSLTYEQYKARGDFSFLSKGTLEKVLEKEGGLKPEDIDTQMLDDSENVVQNKVIKKYVDDEIDEVKLIKYPNITTVGQLTVNGGQVSGFSANDYGRFPFLVDLANKRFEINFDILTGSNVATQENILDSDFGLAFAIRNSRFVLAMSSNGTSWDLGETIGNSVVLPNTQYKIKISYDLADYKVQLSTNGGQSFVNDITKSSVKSLYPKQIYIGVGVTNGQVKNNFSGMIDFTKANLIIDNNTFWVGLDVVGLETRLARDVSNIDEAGIDKIKEIAGGGMPELAENGGLEISEDKLKMKSPIEVREVEGSVVDYIPKATTGQYGVVKYRNFQAIDITPVTVQPNEFVSIDFKNIEFNPNKEAFITRFFGKCYVSDYTANGGCLRVSVCNPTNSALTISKVWFTLISM